MPDDVPPLLVSACLAGKPCRYDGRAKPDAAIIALVEQGDAVPVCAEVMGGLPTPRPPAEITGGSGRDVLEGTARVLTAAGADVTAEFLAGAQEVARIARELGAREAILQDRSPSCGCTQIYDGTHTGQRIAGEGVLAATLEDLGIEVRPADD
ncbi:DUF523 domain-containing protein [Schaalia sp. Marseille-Q2122]|uniref:DUF523 domain-containing protein n=1 Tax=Schaalia sp. Marseille-Q2122 TaxID=2736604 RepID=UPI00158A154E|nr:DUF523 domain-containing protein [Schaalia sp. Marseille-Q2122]